MQGGTRTGWCEVVPSAEAHDLLRLALVIGAAGEVDLNGPHARQTLEQLFSAVESVEAAARRLRDVALAQLVRAMAQRPAAFGDLYDLARMARVTPGQLQRLLERVDHDGASAPDPFGDP